MDTLDMMDMMDMMDMINAGDNVAVIASITDAVVINKIHT
jgi:hypothetical protein